MSKLTWLHHTLLVSVATMSSAAGLATPIAKQERIGNVEPVAQIRGAMPTGVAVSSTGRIFINYPRWGDLVEFTVGEIVNGKPVAYPNEKLNQQGSRETQSQRIVSAQSVVIDPTGSTLWIVDTGSAQPLPISYGGPKLIAIDLKTNQVSRTITIEESALEPGTYLNDVRFMMAKGTAGYAFITDSSSNGGIIIVNLGTGENWRRLGKTRFTMSDPDFYPVVESEILMLRERGKQAKRFNVGSDGIAVSADGKTLYFRSLTSRHLYSISTASLINRAVNEQSLQAMVVDHGQVGGASDGLEADSQGRIYLTDYEHNAIHRYSGSIESVQTIVSGPEVIWPDSLSLADDGYLYFTANQLNRQQIFHNGTDRRVQPYMLFRIKTDGTPIRQPREGAAQGGQSQ
ncbi:L-dopachrome tautomerase-related protein [Vulcanococcus limneticus]|uniref:L-dopachrome tautomerase-related protein n=1 Tax=Vulcanococcus limneticus TaxID=2170428 RepID=UPI00398C00EB